MNHRPIMPNQRFEDFLTPETAALNYAYLKILERAKRTLNWTVTPGQRICDIGSGNFSYAAALHAFFQPARLVGVEVEGHRCCSNGRSRRDEALEHIQHLPGTDYVVADYRRYDIQADIIIAWDPFVTPISLQPWRFPLSLFDPSGLLSRMANNLTPGGTFLMINPTLHEAQVAHHLVEANGLVCHGKLEHDSPLQPHTSPVVLTIWQQG
jgi:hypothetical protein